MKLIVFSVLIISCTLVAEAVHNRHRDRYEAHKIKYINHEIISNRAPENNVTQEAR
jgi:hypothetical protein